MTDHSHDTDEGFHEIQLSGKQLVFLFMATTVVSVVIFLCGVLVGRGVKGDTVAAAEATTAQGPAPSLPPPTEPQPTTIEAPPATPAASQESLSYNRRLEGTQPVKEDLKPPVTEPKPAEPSPAKAQTETPPPAPAPKPTAAPQGGRPGIWAVQVVALSDRGAANAVVQRLNGKGYPAFVLSPQPNGVQHFKVQVGRYTDRSEADQVRQRLKKEEQFEPIIVR